MPVCFKSRFDKSNNTMKSKAKDDSDSNAEVMESQNDNQIEEEATTLSFSNLDVSDDDIDMSFSQNPMMDRVQIALRRQLEKTQERVRNELMEQQESLRIVKRQREDYGVQLYGMQQQLARQQTLFRSLCEEHIVLREKSRSNETKLAIVKKKGEDKNIELEGIRKGNSKCQEEMEMKLDVARQAKNYNQEIKGEVAVARRTAYKAEDDVKDLETSKRAQDLYIDKLNDQIKHLQSDVTLYNEQIRSQNQQTIKVNNMLLEMGTEVKLLANEKRQIVQQWNSSILALTRRDQALIAANSALSEIKFAMKGQQNELMALGRDFFAITNDNENLSLTKNRIQSEIKYVDDEISKVQADQESMSHHFEILQKTLSNTHESEQKIKSGIEKMKSEMSRLIHKIEVVTRERREVEERIGSYKCDQESTSKAVKNLIKEERAIISDIHETEIEAASIRNELARLKIDAINTKVHISQLEGKLETETKTMNEITDKITRCEADVRRRNTEIEKKMNRVDFLNRKYQAIQETTEEVEPLGYLEATIENLRKEVEIEKNEICTFQKKWVEDQTILIDTINLADEIQGKQTEFSSKLNILNHKRLRLLQDVHKTKMTMKLIDSSMKSMHHDISRLNELIGKHTKSNKEFSIQNDVKKKEFKHELKELEDHANFIGVKIENTRVEKNNKLGEILQVEETILLWGEKIKEENEAQTMLNSSDQANEIKSMEKEIQRMKYRLEGMKKKEEKIVREMEFAIHKREDISVKYKHSKATQKSQSNNLESITVNELNQKTNILKKQLKQTGDNIMKLTLSLEEIKRKKNSLTSDCNEAKNHLERLQNQTKELKIQIDDSLFEKQRILARRDRQQSLFEKFDAIESGRVPMINNQEHGKFEASKHLVVAMSKIKRIQNVINGSRAKHQQFDEVLARINILTSDVLDPLIPKIENHLVHEREV